MYRRLGLIVGILTLFSFAGQEALAQKLIICKKYNLLGNPTLEKDEWDMDSNPKHVSFIYNNGKTTIENRHINFIFKPLTHKDIKTDTVKVAIGQSSNWIGTKYGFTAPGDYKVTVQVPNGRVLAEDTVLLKGIRMLEEKPEPAPEKITKKEAKIEPAPVKNEIKKTEVAKIEPPKQVTKPTETVEEPKTHRIYPDFAKMGTSGVDVTGEIQGIELIEDAETEKYFEHLYVQFGREILANMLMGQNEKFKLEYKGTFIECLFTHTKPFETDWIGVSIWRKPWEGKEYSEHVEDQRISIRPTDRSASFNSTYKKRGDYRITLYTDDYKKIGYAYVNFY